MWRTPWGSGWRAWKWESKVGASQINRFGRGFAVLSLCACAGARVGHAQVLLVNDDAPLGGDGLTWATAYRDLQDAISTASASLGLITEIWVAEGSYRPDRGTGDRNLSFDLGSGLRVFGGFIGNETTLSARPAVLRPTILSGDIGVIGDSLDNSYHVVLMRNIFKAATLDGFIVRDGRADQMTFPNNSGGGLLNEGAMTIRNCTFEENFAASGAGLLSRTNPSMIDACVLRNNRATSDGGGALVRDGGMVKNSTFSGNNAKFGGALQIIGQVRVDNCQFLSNYGQLGGGLQHTNGGSFISRCRFVSNCAFQGGAAYIGAGATITHSWMVSNSANQGGGVYFVSGASLLNTLLVRNFAGNSGGATYSAVTGINLRSCTIARNGAASFGGGIYMDNGTFTLANTIVWDNTDGTVNPTQTQQITKGAGTLTVRSTLVQGWTGSLGGTGNGGGNPRFADADGADRVPGTFDDDYHLLPWSAAIDAGDNSFAAADTADLDGDLDVLEAAPIDLGGMPRFIDYPPCTGPQMDGRAPIDIGAYELPRPLPPGDANGDGVVTFGDITAVLANFGAMASICDVDCDGVVGFSDVTMVLANFGS